MRDWIEKHIFELGKVITGKTPPTGDRTFYDGTIPFVTPSDLTYHNYFVTKVETYLSEKVRSSFISQMLPSNSIMYTSIGATIGKIGISSTDVLTNQQINSIIANKKEADSRFVYYMLIYITPYFKSIASGAATPIVNKGVFERTKILVPPLPTQARIAEILSAYDDAIENNNRRITLLEKAASELYKEWFVRMRFPGYENTMIVNGLPEGWEIKRLGEYCHVTDGTHDTPKQADVGVPLITGKHIKNGFIDFNSAYLISESDHISICQRSGLQTGDILLSNIGTVGSACVVNYDREFSVKNVIILKPKCKTETAYLYYLITSSTIQDVLSAQSSGASQQFIGLTYMRRFKILVPNEKVLIIFAKYIKPILNEKQVLNTQSQNLARQRDLLLPRLMSGKLEV